MLHEFETCPEWGARVFNTSGNEGLQDILLDEARGLLYLTNSGFNRIEVFDIKKQHFVNPIPAGQMPHQMAMGGDGKTLYVGNTGGESIGIIDLDLGRVVDNVAFPPVQRNGTANPIYPRSLAMGYFGLQFVMSNGTLWKVVGNQALPRPAGTHVVEVRSLSTAQAPDPVVVTVRPGGRGRVEGSPSDLGEGGPQFPSATRGESIWSSFFGVGRPQASRAGRCGKWLGVSLIWNLDSVASLSS